MGHIKLPSRDYLSWIQKHSEQLVQSMLITFFHLQEFKIISKTLEICKTVILFYKYCKLSVHL